MKCAFVFLHLLQQAMVVGVYGVSLCAYIKPVAASRGCMDCCCVFSNLLPLVVIVGVYGVFLCVSACCN